MAGLIAFAMRNWKLIGIGLLVIAFGITLAVKNGQIASRDRQIEGLNKAVAEERAQKERCQANRRELEASIAAQNTALQRAEAAGAARTASLEQSLSAARRTAQTAREQANAILSRRPGADRCQSALDLIRGE